MSAEAAGEGSRSHDAHLKTKTLVAILQNPPRHNAASSGVIWGIPVKDTSSLSLRDDR